MGTMLAFVGFLAGSFVLAVALMFGLRAVKLI
jgi:Cytochrome B6-F complex subunit VI (PetL)